MAGILSLDRSRYTYAALALAVANLAYWTLFQANIYNSYRLTSETANAAYAMYFYTNFPSLVHGFQFLVFQNQIAMDQLLVMPIFYLSQSALTLLILKEVIISLTGLLVFFTARELTNNRLFSLALLIAYFVNFGIIDMQFFDYHVSDLILPFYILTFYFYMKLDKRGFYISLLLLLLTIESIVQIAIALGAGLILYEYVSDRDAELRKERLKLAAAIVVSSFLVLLMYNAIYYSVKGSYANANSAVPPDLQLQGFPLVPLNSSLGVWSTGNIYSNLLYYLITSFAVLFLSLGIGSMRFPAVTLVFALPWLAGIFVLQNSVFLYSWRFAFVLGGVIAVAILGCMSVPELWPKASDFLKRHNIVVNESQFRLLVATAIVVPAVLVSAYYIPVTVDASTLLNPPQDVFLFSANQTASARLSLISRAISLVPANAPLMTQYNLYSHLFRRRYVGLITNATYFQPEYILWDGDLDYWLYINESSSSLYNYLTTHNYSVLFHEGNAVLVKINSH